MKMRILIASLMIALLPGFAMAQGNGKAKGHDKGNKSVKAKVQHRDVYTQQRVKNNGYKPVKVRTQKVNVYTGYKPKGGPPPWAPAHGYRAKQHVYFPDYYTFYDPYRGGYVYWQNNAWYFTPTVPTFLNTVDLGAARIQLLSDVPLTTHPEVYYTRYQQMYPAHTVNIIVPIPR